MPSRSCNSSRTLGRGAASSGLSTIYEDRVWSMNDSNSSFSESANDPESPELTEEIIPDFLETDRVWNNDQSSWRRRRYNRWASNLLPTRNDLFPLKGLRFWKHQYRDASSTDSLHRLRQSRSVNDLGDYYRGDRNKHANLSAASLPELEGNLKKGWFRRKAVSLATRLGVRSGRDWEDIFGSDHF